MKKHYVRHSWHWWRRALPDLFVWALIGTIVVVTLWCMVGCVRLPAHARWQAERDELRVEYDELVKAGHVRPPTRLERLSATAKGTGEAAEAARRILASQYQGVAR